MRPSEALIIFLIFYVNTRSWSFVMTSLFPKWKKNYRNIGHLILRTKIVFALFQSDSKPKTSDSELKYIFLPCGELESHACGLAPTVGLFTVYLSITSFI